MLVNKINKGFQTRSDVSAINWLGDEWYLVPDKSPLANKIMQLYPRYEFVLDDDGNLVDIVEIPKTEEEINQERVKEIKEELNSLDNTINRATEDLYVLTNTTPYQSTQQVIARKEELRAELQNLNKGEDSNEKTNL